MNNTTTTTQIINVLKQGQTMWPWQQRSITINDNDDITFAGYTKTHAAVRAARGRREAWFVCCGMAQSFDIYVNVVIVTATASLTTTSQRRRVGPPRCCCYRCCWRLCLVRGSWEVPDHWYYPATTETQKLNRSIYFREYLSVLVM